MRFFVAALVLASLLEPLELPVAVLLAVTMRRQSA